MERLTGCLLVSGSVDLSSFGHRHRNNSILPSNFTAPGAKFLKFWKLFQVLRVYFCNATSQDIKSSLGDLKISTPWRAEQSGLAQICSRPANAVHENELLTARQKFLQFVCSKTKFFGQLLG